MKKLSTLVAIVLCAMGANAQTNYTLASDATIIDQTIIDELAAQGASATINIPEGMTVDVNGISEEGEKTTLKIPEGFSVTFLGTGTNKPVLNLTKSIDIAGAHAYVRFENVALADGGCQYVINQSTSTNTEELAFKNVTMNDMSRSLVRLQGSTEHAINKIDIDNCVINNQGSGGYAFLYFNNAAYSIGEVSISNSTFSKMVHNFIGSGGAVLPTINISDCTFYDMVGSGRYLVDANGSTTNINITNTILGKVNTYSDGTSTSKGIRTNGEVAVNNVYQTSDCVWSSNKFEGNIVGLSSEEVFTDAANNDFTLKISEKVGDPRWYDAGGDTDAINTIQANNSAANATVYNMAGQKVTEAFKGIVIMNGKKYVQK